MSTYGARPRSAAWTTPSARLRMEPRVFLSLEVREPLLMDFFFFATLFLPRIARITRIFYPRDPSNPRLFTPHSRSIHFHRSPLLVLRSSFLADRVECPLRLFCVWRHRPSGRKGLSST